LAVLGVTDAGLIVKECGRAARRETACTGGSELLTSPSEYRTSRRRAGARALRREHLSAPAPAWPVALRQGVQGGTGPTGATESW